MTSKYEWQTRALAFLMAAPFIVFFWSVAIASVLLTFGGAIAIVVKFLGAQIAWSWPEILFAFFAGLCLFWLSNVMSESARAADAEHRGDG